MHEVFSQPMPALPDWWKAIVNALEAAAPWLDFEHGRIHSDMPTDLACTLAHAYLTAPASFWHEWEQLAPSRARAVLTWAGQQRHHP